MGRPSPPAYSAPVASTKLSGATRLFTFITLVVVSLGSGLVVLVEGVQEILGITQKSGGEELVNLGESVDRMVGQLVSVLGNSQLAEQTDVKDNLKKLQKILYTFSRQISRINSGGLFTHIRRLVFPEDTHVNRAKQQFDSSRGLLLFGNFIDLLSKSLNLPAAGVEVPKPGQLETPEPSHSSNPPVHDLPRSQERPRRRVAERVQNTIPFPSRSDPHESQSHAQRARPRYTLDTTARNPRQESGQIEAAFINLEIRRRSFQHNCGPIHKMALATALDRLSVLLAKAGRTREALEASQECADLYRTVTDRDYYLHQNTH